MARYEVVFTEDAVDDLDKIKKFYAKQITKRIDAILLQRAEDVTRSSVKKLRGFESLYRLRIGEYRVFYQVQSDEVTILRILSKDEEDEFYKEAKGYENNSDI
ncbi:MAG TPA: type II toxin-antitoxin system RelE/ParE family toxin [Candidatus Binatia bacterium]|nr:type II toxin-antitoxin system RelE/ParE family toxin [Candidatus Binatia bacterium]